MTKKIFQTKKVAVALSGGVDSSVAAALLKKQGYEVVGVFMNLWLGQGGCCSIEDQERARKVAEILKIPFYVVNFSDVFEKKIVEYFLAELKKGKTPNPCVVCNKEIKFGLLLQKAKALGCDYLATGHYAHKQLSANSESITNKRIKEFVNSKQIRYSLMMAKCKEKDQTYFLWKLSQAQLKYILFPLGEIESKQKVRDLAKKFGLPTYATPESNDICFLQGANTFITIVKKVLPGKIVSKDGQVLGEHKGLCFYTIGQRKGIGLSGGPWFVIDKDIKKNNLIVSKNEKDLLRKEVKFENANWLNKPEHFPLKAKAKIRYGADLASCLVYKDKAIFSQPQRAITPGQSVVFYNRNELLGGGIIQ